MPEPRFEKQEFRGELRKVHQGVRSAIYNSDGEILMLYRENEDWDTGWEIVKGSVDEGETNIEAVEREIDEETGVDYRIVDKREDPFDALIPKDDEDDVPVHSWLYIAEYEGGEVEMGEPEHKEYRWMKPSEAKEELWWDDGEDVIDYAEEVISENLEN